MKVVFDDDKKLVTVGEEEFPFFASVRSFADYFSVEDSGLQLSDSRNIIYYRRGFDSEQIVYQYPPEFRGAYFGQYEGEVASKHNLPFPWTYVIVAYEKGQFLGLRHFFSPTQITSLDQELYHTNFPNTNILGYGGSKPTSIGWVCLYRRTPGVPLDTVINRLNYALARYDAIGEPYNYANMSGIDGYCFYKNRNPKAPYTWSPSHWEKKGKDEGLDWTLQTNPCPWIVAKASDPFAIKHDDAGTVYTLRMALYDTHYSYYGVLTTAALNEFVRLSEDDDKSAFIVRHARKAIVKSTSLEQLERKVAPPTALDILKAHPALPNKKSILGFGYAIRCMICGNNSNPSETIPTPNIVVDLQDVYSLTDFNKILHDEGTLSLGKLKVNSKTLEVWQDVDDVRYLILGYMCQHCMLRNVKGSIRKPFHFIPGPSDAPYIVWIHPDTQEIMCTFANAGTIPVETWTYLGHFFPTLGNVRLVVTAIVDGDQLTPYPYTPVWDLCKDDYGSFEGYETCVNCKTLWNYDIDKTLWQINVGLGQKNNSIIRYQDYPKGWPSLERTVIKHMRDTILNYNAALVPRHCLRCIGDFYWDDILQLPMKMDSKDLMMAWKVWRPSEGDYTMSKYMDSIRPPRTKNRTRGQIYYAKSSYGVLSYLNQWRQICTCGLYKFKDKSSLISLNQELPLPVCACITRNANKESAATNV